MDASKELIKSLKNLVGKEVYLMPYGNYATRGVKTQKMKMGTVLKVARVFITMKLNSWGEDKFRIGQHYEGGISLDAGFGSGYTLFRTEGEVEDLNKCKVIAKAINDKYKYQSDWSRLPLAKLQAVQDILEDNNEPNK